MNEITLKVAEAVKKDVGRGLARIDPADIERLHTTIGEIVEIAGKKRTVAKVMPAFKEDRGKGIIQIDGPTRGNAHIGLDEKVTLKKTAWNPADNVVLTPVNAVNLERDSKYIGSLLDGLPVIAGDRIRATLFGSPFFPLPAARFPSWERRSQNMSPRKKFGCEPQSGQNLSSGSRGAPQRLHVFFA